MESFNEMLDILYENLDQKNNMTKFILPEPILIKNGNNMHWKNIKDFLKLAKRPPDHYLNYLCDQISCNVNWLSESKSHGVIIYQKIKAPQLIENMKNYLKEYVFCKSCKSSETYIEKDKTIRRYNFICTNCENKYYI
jgi:translation initiation factor 2 subunit 2